MEATSLGPENLTGGATNYTTVHPSDSNLQIFFICIFIVTFIVGFIGNGLVIFLTGCRMKTTVNSIWFLNLAIADFIFILTFLIRICIRNPLYKSVMYFFTRLIGIIRFASVYFLVVISLDRCLCTWMAVWAQNNRTVLRARIISLTVWVLSICSFIPIFIRNVFLMFPVTYEFFVSFLIPFLIIASSHIAIGVRIKRFKMGKRLRSYRGIIVVILTFFICCFPYIVYRFCVTTINNFSEAREVLQTVAQFSLYLLLLNSCLNPVLYVFMCDEYKKKLKQSLLLVLETAFAEDYLGLSVKTRTTP